MTAHDRAGLAAVEPARGRGSADGAGAVGAGIVVLASGTGTLLQALLDAAADPAYGVRVVAVGSDVADAPALDRAAAAAVPTFVVRPQDCPDRATWNDRLRDAVTGFAPDWVVCAGFMRILGPTFLDAFRGRILNSHPALLPAFPGAHPVRDTLASGVKVTGATIHLVDDGIDTGPVVTQRAVEVRDDDTEESLHERIKVVEREMLVQSVAAVVRGLHISGRKVTLA